MKLTSLLTVVLIASDAFFSSAFASAEWIPGPRRIDVATLGEVFVGKTPHGADCVVRIFPSDTLSGGIESQLGHQPSQVGSTPPARYSASESFGQTGQIDSYWGEVHGSAWSSCRISLQFTSSESPQLQSYLYREYNKGDLRSTFQCQDLSVVLPVELKEVVRCSSKRYRPVSCRVPLGNVPIQRFERVPELRILRQHSSRKCELGKNVTLESLDNEAYQITVTDGCEADFEIHSIIQPWKNPAGAPSQGVIP